MDFEGNRDEDNGRKPQGYSGQEDRRNRDDESRTESFERMTAWEKMKIEQAIKEGVEEAKRRRVEKAASGVKELYDAFLKAGFSEKQALFLASGLIISAGQKDE